MDAAALSEVMKIADYLGDGESVQTLATILAALLPTNAACSAGELALELADLPNHLAEIVVWHHAAPLHDFLRLLPPNLHPGFLESRAVAGPDHKCLTVEACSCDTLKHLVSSLPQALTIKQLSMHMHVDRDAVHDLMAHFLGLPCNEHMANTSQARSHPPSVLQHLAIIPKRSRYVPRSLSILTPALISSLAAQTALTHLSLCECAIEESDTSQSTHTSVDLEPTTPLATLTALQHLDLSNRHNRGNADVLTLFCFHHLPVLTHLSLGGNMLNDDLCRTFAAAMTSLSSLLSLSLRRVIMSGVGAKALLGRLSSLSALASLDFSQTYLYALPASTFHTLSCLPTLTFLGLSESRPPVAALEAIRQLPALRHLDLGHNERQDNFVATFACQPALTHLNLGKEFSLRRPRGVNPGLGYSEFATSLTLLAHLEHLNISRLFDCRRTIGLDSICVACTAQISVLTKLTYLDVSHNLMDRKGAAAFSANLSGLSSLQYLSVRQIITDLGGDDVSSSWVRMFGSSLARLPLLTFLDLSENDIGFFGVSALAPSISRLANLKHLYMACYKIDREGSATFARSLRSLTSLKGLDLSTNPMGDEGAAALAPALAVLTNLTSLTLNCINIGEAGAVALGSTFALLTTLCKLRMFGNNLSSQALAALAPHLAYLFQLRELELGDFRGEEGMLSFVEHIDSLPRLTALFLYVHHIESETQFVKRNAAAASMRGIIEQRKRAAECAVQICWT